VISARSEARLVFVSADFFRPIEEAMFELLLTQLAGSDGANAWPTLNPHGSFFD
jgi:hypothetical protein